MLCSNCGANIPDDSKACSYCGVPVNQQQPQFQQPEQQAQPAYQQPVYQSPAFSQPVPHMTEMPGKGMGVASLVLGIVSLVMFCIWYLSLPCGIVGLILGVVSMNKAKSVGMRNGTAVGGLVCSCIALGLTILVYVLAIIGLAELAALGMTF